MDALSLTIAVALATVPLQQVPLDRTAGGRIDPEEKQYQEEVFQLWWGTPLVWDFAELPEKGSVEKFRVPYSGYYYPDAAGGTTMALRKYDQAFHGGRLLATAHEQHDTTSQREQVVGRAGLFGRRRVVREQTPGWHGHCNGWTSAAIRHPEPQRSVSRNGVVFTPADIKGLLAEIYMYNRTEFLGGTDDAINPGTLHAVITNWIGRGSHPLGMDAHVGREVWNYPLYAFATSSARRSPTQVEVKMNVAYAMSTDREYDRGPRLQRTKYFHYMLYLDEEGRIRGGSYFADSSQLDMLWAPLAPAASGQPGNELGNPHVDVAAVLAIWRESVPEPLRRQWLNIDPTEEDRVVEPGEQEADSVENGNAADNTAADAAGATGADAG